MKRQLLVEVEVGDTTQDVCGDCERRDGGICLQFRGPVPFGTIDGKPVKVYRRHECLAAESAMREALSYEWEEGIAAVFSIENEGKTLKQIQANNPHRVKK